MAIQRSTLVTKAQELMNTEWLDGASAAKKARELMTATTPVTATSQINQDQLAKNQASRQTPQVTETPIAWKTTPSGATLNANWTVANAPLPTEQQINAQYGWFIQDNWINSVQPINAPTEMPAQKVETVKAPTIKPTEAPIDFNSSQGREQDIQSNIKQITTDNPALLKDRNAYNQAFGYDTADQGKKAMLDASFNTGNQVPTASAMYNNIVAKADIPDDLKTSLSYKIANNRYMKANMYSTMTPSQLSSEMTNSKLVQGSQAYEDLKAMNPKLVQDTENLRIVNGSKQNVFTYTNNPDWTKVKTNNLEKTFAQDYIDNFWDAIKQLYAVQTPEQIRAIIRTPDVVQAEEKASEIEIEMNELEKQIDNVSDDVDKEMTWSGATGSRVALEKAIRKDKLEKAYNSALKNYTTYANKANNLITQNTTLYTTSQAQKVQQANAMLPILQDQYKTAQAKAQAEAALNDPATAIQKIVEEYKKLWVPFTRSTQEIIKDFQSSGQDIATYLTELQKTIQSKPEYQAYKDKQSGTEWQSTSITRYNPSTGANESTPIFYRKKTNWEFEAVDISGNKIDASAIGGGISGTPWAISSTGDMSGLASNYPYEASFKNNNTSGITWGMSANTKKLLENAWIKISEGTARPSREGGKYVKFDNISDWLLAHKILLSQAGSDDINARLQQWVWTKEWPTYAKNLMDQAWIKAWTKFSQLTPEQLDKLVMVQVKKESPWMYKELTKWTTTTPAVQASASDQKAFESYDGKSIPEQYKTPAEKKAFVDKYNAWRASRPWTKIETGNDILNIKIDKPTEWQSASQSYTSRMLNAVNNLMPLEKKFLELGTGWQVAQTYLPALLKSSDQKMMDAEKKNFITAVLRKQSGASIAPSEFAGEEMKYFPQPWDSKEVVIAKQNARNAEIKAMLATAWVDAEWNSLSKYYNPPIISNDIASTWKATTVTSWNWLVWSNGKTYKFR